MKDIDDINWSPLLSGDGRPGTLEAEFIMSLEQGDFSDYDELFESVCHQFSLGTASFAAAVRLTRLAHQLPVAEKIQVLSIVGHIEAARIAHAKSAPELPAELQDLYRSAIADALVLTSVTLGHGTLDPSQSYLLIAVVAALQGHASLALHLFLCPDDCLSCPECGEAIDFIER